MSCAPVALPTYIPTRFLTPQALWYIFQWPTQKREIKNRGSDQTMYLLLPVKSLLAYCAVGLSSASLIMFLLTASPLEIQFLGVFLNALSAGLGFCMVYHFLPAILERLEDEKQEEDCEKCRECRCIQDHDTQRTVEERDGSLYVTAAVEELRELAEAPVVAPPVEETAEFADLLAEKKDN